MQTYGIETNFITRVLRGEMINFKAAILHFAFCILHFLILFPFNLPPQDTL